jgi:Tol biopolymer transport system component
MKRFAMFVLALALVGNVLAAQDLERLFKAAVNMETVDRNCKGAIEQYKKVAAGSDRAVAALALLRMAGCYQNFGDAEAQRIYARIVSDFREQTEVVAQARLRLATPATGRPRGDRVVQTEAATSGEGRVSPDGRFVSYVSWSGPTGLNLMLHDLVAKTDRALTNVDWNGGAAYDSTFSPDGKQVAYGWRTYGNPAVNEVRVVRVDSSGIPQPRTIFTNPEIAGFSPTDWSADGRTLAVLVKRTDGTSQIALIGLDGSFTALKTIEGWRSVNKIFFSPDGKYLAYDAQISDSDLRRDLFILATDASGETPVHDPADDNVMGWSNDGRYLLFASDRNTSVGLWAVPINDGKPASAALLMRPDIGTVLSQGVTRAGTLFTVKSASTVNLQVVPVDLDRGKVTGPPSTQIYRPQTPQSPAWSPDGKLLAYAARSANEQTYIAIRDVASNRVQELHPALVYIPMLRWFPDGKSVLVHGRDIKRRFMTLRIDIASGQETLIVPGPSEGVQISPDGKTVYYVVPDGGSSRAGRMFAQDVMTGIKREVFRKPDDAGRAVLSPDCRMIALIRVPPIDRNNPNGTTSTVYLHPVDGGATREVTIPAIAEAFHGFDWMPDGKALLVPARSPEPALWVVPANGAAPRKLDIDIRTWGTAAGIRVHPSGKQVAYFTGQETREVWMLENVLPTVAN